MFDYRNGQFPDRRTVEKKIEELEDRAFVNAGEAALDYLFNGTGELNLKIKAAQEYGRFKAYKEARRVLMTTAFAYGPDIQKVLNIEDAKEEEPHP